MRIKNSLLEVSPIYQFIFNQKEKDLLNTKGIDNISFEINNYNLALGVIISIKKKNQLVTVTLQFDNDFCHHTDVDLYVNLLFKSSKMSPNKLRSSACTNINDGSLEFEFAYKEYFDAESLQVYVSEDVWSSLIDEKIVSKNWTNEIVNDHTEIKVQETIFKVNKNTFKSSDYFMALVKPEFKECKQGTPVELFDKALDAKAVSFCLKYMEVGVIVEPQFNFFLDLDNCIKVAKAADYFMLNSLKERVMQIIYIYHTEVGNICKILSLDLIEKEYREFAIRFLVDNRNIVKSNEKVKDELISIWGTFITIDDIADVDENIIEDEDKVEFYEMILRGLM